MFLSLTVVMFRRSDSTRKQISPEDIKRVAGMAVSQLLYHPDDPQQATAIVDYLKMLAAIGNNREAYKELKSNDTPKNSLYFVGISI